MSGLSGRVKAGGVSVLFMLASLAVAQAADGGAAQDGTTIVGERDAAVGLYLMPWQEESALDVDRPPGMFDVSLQPIDVDGFGRWVEYEDARARYRRERLHRTK